MEDLKDELLIKIFDYLDEEDIKSAASACDNWHRMICNSPIIRNLCLQIDLDEDLMDAITASALIPYVNYRLINRMMLGEKQRKDKMNVLILMLTNVKAFIKSFHMEDFHHADSNLFEVIAPKLTHLSLTDCHEKNVCIKLINFPNLKYMELRHVALNLCFFRAPELEKLSIENSTFYGQSYREFLSKCNKLESLSLKNFKVPKARLNASEIRFNIKYFKYESENSEPGMTFSLHSLLHTQRNSLREVEINAEISLNIFKLLINEMNLKKLIIHKELSFPDAQWHSSLFYPILINSTIETLKLKLINTDAGAHNIIEDIFSDVTGLKDLDLSFSYLHNLECLNSSPQLKRLTLRNQPNNVFIKGELSEKVLLERIEELQIRQFPAGSLFSEIRQFQPEKNHLLCLIHSCPNIRKVTIKGGSEEIAISLNDEEFSKILKLKNLREFYLRGNVEFDNEILMILLNNDKLRRLTIETDNVEKYKDFEDILKATKIHTRIFKSQMPSLRLLSASSTNVDMISLRERPTVPSRKFPHRTMQEIGEPRRLLNKKKLLNAGMKTSKS